MKSFPNNSFVPPVIKSEKANINQIGKGGNNMQSVIEQSYALGETVSVSLIVELLKCMYAHVNLSH